MIDRQGQLRQRAHMNSATFDHRAFTLPPDGEDWRIWLVLGGRGAGKTRAGAEWVRARALNLWPGAGPRAERIAIVAPTFDEARLVMIEGKSGLLAVHGADERPRYEPSKRQITWANGAIAQIFSADEAISLEADLTVANILANPLRETVVAVACNIAPLGPKALEHAGD